MRATLALNGLRSCYFLYEQLRELYFAFGKKIRKKAADKTGHIN